MSNKIVVLLLVLVAIPFVSLATVRGPSAQAQSDQSAELAHERALRDREIKALEDIAHSLKTLERCR